MIGRRIPLFALGLLFLAMFLTGCLAKPGSPVTSSRMPKPAKSKLSKTELLSVYADYLGVNPKELKNPNLYSYIEEWMGAPHRLGGYTKAGIDCSAFINQLYLTVYGRQLPRSSYEMANQVKRKYERQLQEGDLVFFSFGKGKKVDHVGLYLHNNKFVHVSTKRGVMISDLHESWFYKYFVRAGSVKK